MAYRRFESVAEAERRARRRLPPSVFRALVAGSEQGVSTRDNIDAFGELGFAPTVADKPAVREQSTTVMGLHLSMPVLLSPAGVQALHPDGEVAAARGAASRGTAIGLSAFASRAIEEVVAANPRTLAQLYWCGTREQIAARLERARLAGAVGLILTLDWSFAVGRDWGSPTIPSRLDLRSILRHAPELICRPAYVRSWVAEGRLPELTVPNMAASGEAAPPLLDAYGDWVRTPPPSWRDVRWLKEEWDGPMMVKGVVRIDDARRAVDSGADAISVSNHGGNNLDGTPAPIRVLGAVVDAVGDDLDVLLDGGVRRGSDVVKALALGAKAVMIGRAYLWGLAANGQAGVENVLDVLSSGIDAALLGLGKGSVEELVPNDLLVGAGFARPSADAGRWHRST